MAQDKCQICGDFARETHHLVFGTSNRRLSDQDGLIIRLCPTCHTQIHREVGGAAGTKSKQLGQVMYELKQMVEYGATDDQARESFRTRYGKSYL